MPFEPDKPAGKFTADSSQIPTSQKVRAPAPVAEEVGDFEKVLRKAGEAATAVGPMGVAAGTALKFGARLPQAVRAAAGPVERMAVKAAEAMTPTSLKQLGAATTSAGIAGASGEAFRQKAEERGAGPTEQYLSEFTGALVPSAARAGAERALAPAVEAMGKKLYKIPEQIKTPKKEEALQTAEQAGMQILPGQIRESRSLQAIERMLQLLPGSKDEFVRLGRQNQEAANRAVAKAFGGLEPSIAADAMQTAKGQLQTNYDSILSNKSFAVGGNVENKLIKAFTDNEDLRQFALANPRLGKFAESLQQGDRINGKFWKEVRSDIADYVYGLQGASKAIGKNVLESFDDIARNNLPQAEYEALRGVDRKWAALKSFEDAFTRDPSLRIGSDVDINKFARQYANVEPINVLYGQTGGRGGEYVPLSTMAEQYKVFTRPRIPQTEATTLGGLLRAGTGMSLFAGGLAGGLPYVPTAGAAYLATPPLAKKAAQAYLDPQKTAAAMKEAGISPFALYPMLTSDKK